jgi:hypothetical protein
LAGAYTPVILLIMKTLNDTKFYLKAKTAEGLKILMLRNNISRQAYHGYTIIFADGFWFAWYDGPVDEFVTEKLNAIDGRQG